MTGWDLRLRRVGMTDVNWWVLTGPDDASYIHTVEEDELMDWPISWQEQAAGRAQNHRPTGSDLVAALGHVFGNALVCRGCGVTYERHCARPRACREGS